MSVKDTIPGYNALVLPYHLAQTELSGLKNRWPAKKLRVIGVTGTNGKTTTCFMIWQMLNSAGFKTGLITTVAWGGVPEIHKQIEHMTTPKVSTLNKRIKEIKQQGAEFLVLEVTSHALAQYRTLGIPIEIAIMTNVTREHLDYHKTFDRYVKAKTKLFKNAKHGIINLDDPSWKDFKFAIAPDGNSKKYTTYGIDEPCDLQAVKIKLDSAGVRYKARREGEQTLDIKLNLPGKFNVYNSLAAIAVGQKLGLTPDQIETGLSKLEEVEGRMTRIEQGQPFDVIVDFAHTPDAFEKVFASVASKGSVYDPARPKLRNLVLNSENTKDPKSPNPARLNSGNTKDPKSPNLTHPKSKTPKGGPKLISLFGGAGRRDESTRAPRAEIAAKYSDVVILTEDDSRDEDPETIIKDFQKGLEKAIASGSSRLSPEGVIIEPNREKAIAKALKIAEKGDLVLLLGKGHEKTILRADGPHAFEDITVATELLKTTS